MLVRDNPGKSLALEIERQGSPLSLTLIPESKPGNGKAIGFVGIEPKVIPLPDEYKVVRQVWAVQRHRRSHGQNVAADEADGQYAGKIDYR